MAIPNWCNGVHWSEATFARRQRLAEVIGSYQPAAIIHFAGLIEVAQSTVDPLAFFENTSRAQ